MRNGTPSSDQSTSKCVPLIGTRPPADFIMARRSEIAAYQTPNTWPRPTRLPDPNKALAKGPSIHGPRRTPNQQTFYRWRKLYGGMQRSQLARLKELEKENQRLWRAVSDLTLDKLILTEAARGNF